ncbi:MAG: hypothetical protein NZ606_06895, partial [Candidatus Kapabacteria bacterium]|nr:hypothetical protein [Candidatus Kapabacteria bacterium]
MNPAQIHLAVNHAPLFCALIAAGLIIGALVRRNRSFVYAAIWLSVVGAILAIVAQQSGEAAEHILEGIEGINSSLIEAHEEAAKTAMLSSIV